MESTVTPYCYLRREKKAGAVSLHYGHRRICGVSLPVHPPGLRLPPAQPGTTCWSWTPLALRPRTCLSPVLSTASKASEAFLLRPRCAPCLFVAALAAQQSAGTGGLIAVPAGIYARAVVGRSFTHRTSHISPPLLPFLSPFSPPLGT